MPGKTTRSSNLELLRILCMLLIIGDHLTGQAKLSPPPPAGGAPSQRGPRITLSPKAQAHLPARAHGSG